MKDNCFYLIVFILSFFSVSCGKSADEKEESSDVDIYVEAASQNSPDFRTAIAGPGLDKVVWSEADRISLYWKPSGSGESLFSAVLSPFRIYHDEAVFTANVNDMGEGTFRYYAVSPLPSSVEGTVASFPLSPVQSGNYSAGRLSDELPERTQPVYDIMVADPQDAPSLTRADGNLSVSMKHKCHVMRIQVPEGRNVWGADIRRLRIEFPVPVAGTLKVDMENPASEPVLADGVNTVDLYLGESFGESPEDSADGKYVWAFLAPVQVTGDVVFTAYDVNGYQSASVTVSMDKKMEAGRITPVSMTIPEELPVSWIDFSITGNNLGEEVHTMTVKAPEGARFRNGKDSTVFRIDGSSHYRLGYYAAYDGIDNLSVLQSGDFTVKYESENAIVSHKVPVGTLDAGEVAARQVQVPYLFFEDFSGAASRDGRNTTELLDAVGLQGWSGSNYSVSGGEAIRIHMYAGTINGLGSGDIRRGRMDTPPLSGIKSGHSVDIDVSFDTGGTMVNGTFSSLKMYSNFTFGTDSRTGAIPYENDLEYVLPGASDVDPGADGSYASVPYHADYVVSGVQGSDRLSWRSWYRLEGSPGWSVITAKTVYVYLDNIKVSIKKN